MIDDGLLEPLPLFVRLGHIYSLSALLSYEFVEMCTVFMYPQLTFFLKDSICDENQ